MLRGIWGRLYLGRGVDSLVAAAFYQRGGGAGPDVADITLGVDTQAMPRRHKAQYTVLKALAAASVFWASASCTLAHSLKVVAHRPPHSESDADDSAEGLMAQLIVSQPVGTPTQLASPKDTAQARALWAQGQADYHRGNYTAAEQAFKEALILQPFLAPAHLALGKIYLLRGVAADDVKRLSKGRRLVEMALKLDPHLADAAVLLALFP